MKYLLYRSPGSIEKDVTKHELVAVEFGTDIYEVTEALVEAASQDLAGMPEYEGCQTAAYAPEPLKPFRRCHRRPECRPWCPSDGPFCPGRSSRYVPYSHPW